MGTRRKSIVIFSAYYPPHMGGIERFVYSLASELETRGVHAIVVTCGVDASLAHELEQTGVEVFRIPSVNFAGGRLPIIRRGADVRRVLEAVSRHVPTGVLVNTRFYGLSAIGAKFAAGLGVHAVLLDHGSGYIGFGIPLVDQVVHIYEHVMTSRLRRFKPHFYGISGRSAEWLRTFGVRAHGVISNAIDGDEFRTMSSGRDFRAECGVGPQDLFVVFTGRLLRQKGLGAIAEAAYLVSQSGSSVHFALAGDGPDRAWIESRLPANVRLLGRLSRPDVSALLQQANVFLFPSDTEGMATSLLEAGASGLACISTDVGGAREVMPDASCGTIVESAAPEVLAEAVLRYDSDRALAASHGAAARARVDDSLTWESTADAVIEACAKANGVR